MSTMTLQLPSTYVNVEKDEMEYVDGGWAFDLISVKLAGAAFNAAITLALGGGIGVAGIQAYIRKVGREEASKIFTRTIKSKLIAMGASGLAFSVGRVVDTALNYLDIGTAIARGLDSIDARPNNGWLTI